MDVPDGPISVPPEMVSSAIRSFPHGSAGGPDGLRPQHLKDLFSAAVIEGNPSHHLLIALTSFTNLVLEGRTPSSICPAFFGASLITLDKKGEKLSLLQWVPPSIVLLQRQLSAP